MLRQKHPAPVEFAAAAVIALFLAGCATHKSAPADTAVKSDQERRPAPAFSLKDADGKPVTLADYKGKVVLVNFWATWCGPCELEIPWFIEFQQKYKDQDFAVLGISMDDDGWKSVKPYVASHKINYPIVIGDEKTSTLYGNIDSLPTSFILDRSGRIAAQHFELVDKSVYQNEILSLLRDKTAGSGSPELPVARLFGRPGAASAVRPE